MRFDLGFRPTLWATVFAIPAVLVMLGLGTWQVERRAWKQDVIETRKARIAAPVTALPAGIRLASDEYRRVRVTGRFRHDRETLLGARSFRGNAGYYLFTPFALTGGTEILVNRGWIPLTRKDAILRAQGQTEGEVTLVAHIRGAARVNPFAPDNQPEKNFWFWVDPPAMAKHLGIEDAQPWYLQIASPTPAGGWPRPVPVRVEVRNAHLQYAITWYSLALTLVVIYVLYHRRRRRPGSGETASASSGAGTEGRSGS